MLPSSLEIPSFRVLSATLSATLFRGLFAVLSLRYTIGTCDSVGRDFAER